MKKIIYRLVLTYRLTALRNQSSPIDYFFPHSKNLGSGVDTVDTVDIVGPVPELVDVLPDLGHVVLRDPELLGLLLLRHDVPTR